MTELIIKVTSLWILEAREIVYKFFYIFGFLIRNFVVPNPFNSLQGQTIEINGLEFPIIPEIINILVEPILGVFTFIIVGLYYSRSSGKPIIGSILYLLFYCIHTAIIFVIFQLNRSTLLIILVITSYIFLLILIAVITSKIRKLLSGLSY